MVIIIITMKIGKLRKLMHLTLRVVRTLRVGKMPREGRRANPKAEKIKVEAKLETARIKVERESLSTLTIRPFATFANNKGTKRPIALTNLLIFAPAMSVEAQTTGLPIVPQKALVKARTIKAKAKVTILREKAKAHTL